MATPSSLAKSSGAISPQSHEVSDLIDVAKMIMSNTIYHIY